jgi:hypothetical protein
MPRCAVALRSRFQNGMVVAWHGRGMGAVWHVWIKHGCTVWIKRERQSKPVAARHGRGMGAAWERHGVSELTLWQSLSTCHLSNREFQVLRFVSLCGYLVSCIEGYCANKYIYRGPLQSHSVVFSSFHNTVILCSIVTQFYVVFWFIFKCLYSVLYYLSSVNDQEIWALLERSQVLWHPRCRPRLASYYCTQIVLCNNMYPREMENYLIWGEILWMDVLHVTLGVVSWVAG